MATQTLTQDQKAAIKTNWKNNVRFYFEGGTFSELKDCVKTQIDKEIKNYEEWGIRRSPEFRDALTNKLY